MSHTYTNTRVLTHGAKYKHTGMHTPGLTEPLLQPWSILVPPPPEPHFDSPLRPAGLLTQRANTHLTHTNNPAVTFPLNTFNLNAGIRFLYLTSTFQQQ